MAKTSVEKTIREIFQKQERAKEILVELNTIQSELSKYGIKIHSVETIQAVKSKSKSRKPRSKVTNEEILKFIETEKTAKDLVEGLNLGYQTASKKLKSLVNEKLAIVSRQDGLKIYYKVK
jgi:DNA-binding transcriptional ArsR family regulator